MSDYLPSIKLPDFTQSSSFKAVQESIQRVAAENEAVRKIALTSTSGETAKFIYSSILDFSSRIGEDYEVGLQVTTLGSAVQVYLSELSYHDPHLVIFGSEHPDGTKVRIVQHVTQLNYALIAMPKLKPEAPKRKIGFFAE